MSILEKKTGSGIDALIISLIMAKVFLLEYLGMAGIVNNVIFLLIGVRLIFSGWKIPKKLLFLVCLITMLLVLSYSAGSIVPGKTSYNLLFLCALHRDAEDQRVRFAGFRQAAMDCFL